MNNSTISIPLSKTGKKHAGKYVAIVDAIDADLAEFSWSVRINKNTCYAIWHYEHRKTLHLHRVVLARKLERDKLLPDEKVDHIDGNGLNNTRDNLRVATQQQNTFNSTKKNNNKSGYKGVYKHQNKWRATIMINGKIRYLGLFDTPELAHQAYCEAAKKLHGEFAKYD